MTLARPAQAQLLTKDDFAISVQVRDGSSWDYLGTNDAPYFFNRARCDCQTPIRVVASLSATGIAKRAAITQGSLRMYVGPDCLDTVNTTARDARCELLGSETALTSFASSGLPVETSVDHFVTPKTGAGCDPKLTVQTVWLFVDFEPDMTPDLIGSAAPTLAVNVDTQPPAAPSVKDVKGGNEALIVEWSASATVMDMAGYTIFCARGEDIPVFKSGTFERAYMSKATLCPTGAVGAPGEQALGTASGGAADGGTDAATGDVAPSFPAFGKLKDLDPAYLCAGLLSATTTSRRISVLQNGIPYLVGVAAIDKSGNASPLSAVYLQSPVPSRDFYKGYCRERRGTGAAADCPSGCATGGLGAGQAGTLASAAILAAAIGAPRRRRRR